MSVENKHRFIVNFAYYLVIVSIIYFIFKYVVGFLTPFLAAYIISALLRPLVKFLTSRTKLRNRSASLIVVVLFFITIGAVAVIIGTETVSFLKEQFTKLPAFYASSIEPMLKTMLNGAAGLRDSFDPALAAAIDELSGNLLTYVGGIISSLSETIVSYVSGVAMSLPSTVLKMIFSVISTFYFTSDYDCINDFIRTQIGDVKFEKLTQVRGAVRGIILSYIRSYSIILGITFAELTAALLILGVRGAVMIALLIAIFDILPVVGTGTILLPWAVIELVGSDYGMGIGLLVAYAVIFIVRNIIEPKIVGTQVGLHPLVTLIAMFVGTMLFGVVGLFGVPIIMALTVDLNGKGVIKVFNSQTRDHHPPAEA